MTSPTSTPPEASKATLDPREFRQVLGTFTTGVTIITARGEDGTPAGVTANSFNSVSIDPPLVLWSLAKKSNSLATFTSASHWAVHILAHHQDDLSSHFARSVSGQEKFDGVPYEPGLGNAPLLSECTARLQCRTTNLYDGGDHIILVGEVLTFDKCDTPPLVFQRGSYAIATSTAQPAVIPSGGDPRNFGEDSPILYLLSTAYLHFSAKLREATTKLNLNSMESLILSALGARDGRTYHELATLARYAGSSVCPEAINDLVARGFIQVHESSAGGAEDDHAHIMLSPSGRAVVDQIQVASDALENELMSQLGVPETLALRALLTRFVRTYNPTIPYTWF